MSRPYFDAADWLWDPIPAGPTLHAHSVTWSGYLAAGMHIANLDEYANAIVYPDEISGGTPRYSVSVDMAPAWGPNPFTGHQIPVPAAAHNRVVAWDGDNDAWLIVADPVSGKVFHLWQARWTGSTWRASWGQVVDFDGNGVGGVTGSGISNFAGTIRLAELQAAAAANTGLGHALQFSSDATAGSLSTQYLPPADKTDGHLWPASPGISVPVWQGARFQLDPSINVDSIPGITAAEKVIAKTLQSHGMYLIDNGGARAAFMFERQANGSIAGYSALGLGWDYYDLSHIPWGSLRVLSEWDGGVEAAAELAGTVAATTATTGTLAVDPGTGATVHADNFDRPDGPLGEPWETYPPGDVVISGGQAAALSWDAVALVNIGIASGYRVSCRMSNSAWPFLIFSSDAAGATAYMVVRSAQLELIRAVGGPISVIQPGPNDPGGPLTVWAEIREVSGGTEITWGYDSTIVGTFADTTATRPAGTWVGFRNQPGNLVDDFMVEDAASMSLSGAADAVSGAAGGLSEPPAFAGTAASASATAGAVTVDAVPLAGAAASTTTTSGWMAEVGSLSGTAAADSATAGTVTVDTTSISGTAASVTTTAGALDPTAVAPAGLSGGIDATSASTGALVPDPTTPPPPAPGDPAPESFGIRLACYDIDGPLRGYARAALIERYARAGETGRLAVDFSEHAPRGPMLATVVGGVEVGVEIAVEYLSGDDWVEPEDGRYVIAQDTHERTADPSRSHDLSLLGIGQRLNGPKVLAIPDPADKQSDGKRQFLSKTPGQIIGTLITEAQARGAIPGITTGFTAVYDSHGAPWPSVYNRAYELNHSILGILQNLHDGGAVDYWWNGRTLHMVPAGNRGRDLSGGADAVYLRDKYAASSPERDDWTRLADHVMLIGDEGKTFSKTNPAAVTPFGRQETVILAGGVSDEGTAQIMMDRALAEGAAVARQLTREWQWAPGVRWMPDRDLRLGDWVLADTAIGARQRVRVADLMTRQGPDGIEAFVTLGTVADDLMTRMAKRQVGIEGGAGVGSIGRPTLPPPPDPTNQWAQRPAGFTVDVSAWPIPGGYGGVLGASWDAVTTDTEGYAFTPDGYIVRARKQGGAWMDLFRTTSLSGHAERSDMRPGEVWEAEVAAYRNDRTGVFSLTWSGTVPEDTQAPPVPSPPTGQSPPAQIVVTWDGTADGGGRMPLDTRRIEVSLNGQTDEAWTIPVSGGSFRQDAGPVFQIGDTVEAKIRAVDFAGNASDWTSPIWIVVSVEIAWPESPGSLIASAQTYTTSEGLYRGVIDASWGGVSTDVDGNPVNISGYVVRARRIAGQFVTDWFDLFTSDTLSGSGSSPLMEVGDVWEVTVAAVSTDGHTGPFATPVQVVIPPDTIPPPVPSTPVVTSDLGMLTVAWDGLSQSGGGMPPDLSHLEVHVTGIAEPWRMDTITRLLHLSSGDGQLIQPGTAYEVRLKAVDYADNASGLSNAAAPVTVKTATAGLQDAIDQIEADYQAADAALQGQIDSIVVSSSGGVVTWMGPTTPVAPAERPHMAGDLWWDTTARTQKRYDGTGWVAFQLGDAGIWGISAAKITTGYLDAARIKADAAWVSGKLLVGASDEMVVDPSWQNTDLNASRTRAGWTVAPGAVTHTRATAEDFYLGVVSDWSDNRAHLPLRPGVRYRVEATVRLAVAGQVSLVQRNANGGYSYLAGPTNLGANTDYVLVGEFTWEQWPGSFGVRMDQPGTIKAVSVRPMLSQILIQDGAITAPKIASNAITADKIDAGAITAAKLHADALNFKSATGLILTAPNIQTDAAANRGKKVTTTHERIWNNSGVLVHQVDYATGDIQTTGELKSAGAYPWIEITKNVGGTGFAGLRFMPGPGWNATPWLRTNAVRHGTDTPGSFYLEGASSTDLTMKPSLILRSGTVVSGADRYWPQIELRLGRATHYGHIRLSDIGERKTDINMWADFYSLTTKTGQSITMPVPGTPGDIRIWSTNGGVLLNTGNGWITMQGIGSTSGGQDLSLEGGWRVTYRSSLSRDKLDQRHTGPLYELLEIPAVTWVDRARREQDETWGTRYAGVIFEDVQRVSDAHGGSLDPLLIYRGGEPSSVAYNALGPMLLPIIADMNRRLKALEAAHA